MRRASAEASIGGRPRRCCAGAHSGAEEEQAAAEGGEVPALGVESEEAAKCSGDENDEGGHGDLGVWGACVRCDVDR